MAKITANGIQLEYESFGDEGAPVILLIMGLGCQLLHWPEAFCQLLAQGGYRVVRYDNRDIGLSDKLDHLGKPKVLTAGLRQMVGLKVKTAYTLDDMAEDAAGLLDALKIARAHVVGVSMGGMIGQILAAKKPERVLSFTCIMSTSGARELPKASMKLQMRMARRPERIDREGLIEHSYQTWRLLESPGYPETESDLRAHVQRIHDRAFFPRGIARQTVAILAGPSRVPLLRKITAPTLIIHGDRDPLVPPAAAPHLARHIPGAKLEMIEGMGHNLPTKLQPRIAQLVLGNARSAKA